MALDDQGFDDSTEIGGTARLLALSDGIFAIAATLLVLNLNPKAQLEQDGPSVGGYVLSFVVVGVFWLRHHRLFNTIRRADARLLALNLAFLFFVSALPFVTGVLTINQEHNSAYGTSLYAGTLALMALLQLALWLYACAGRRLVPADIPQRAVVNRAVGMTAALVIFASSIPIAFFVDAGLAKYWWLLLIPLSAVLRWVFHSRESTHDQASAPASASPSASSSPRSTTRA